MAIITISREMGTGGRNIANRVAEKLGYLLIDGSAIRKVAADYGLTPDAVDQADEKPPAFVEKLDEKTELDLHLIELIILEYALKGNVLIYGRGGQDLLQDIQSVFRVRITAPFEERVERWAEKEWLDPDLARIMVRKSDQQRAGFVRYYFDRDWNDPLNYDLIINTQRMSEDSAVKLISQGVHDSNLQELKDESKKTLNDLILRKKAEIAIMNICKLESQHLGLEVHAGVITLTGHVHSEADHKMVLETVGAIEGIKKVQHKQMRIIDYHNNPKDP